MTTAAHKPLIDVAELKKNAIDYVALLGGTIAGNLAMKIPKVDNMAITGGAALLSIVAASKIANPQARAAVLGFGLFMGLKTTSHALNGLSGGLGSLASPTGGLAAIPESVKAKLRHIFPNVQGLGNDDETDNRPSEEEDMGSIFSNFRNKVAGKAPLIQKVSSHQRAANNPHSCTCTIDGLGEVDVFQLVS